MKGIDVSEHNGIINWEKVKSQIDFAIIRVSYGLHSIDKMAKRNIEECIRLGINFGVYFYSYALNITQVKTEVQTMLEFIKPYKEKILYPVIIDMEDADHYKEKHGMPSNEMLVDICETACNIIGSAGYFPTIYASQSWFMRRLRSDKLQKFCKWIAWWYEKAVFDKAEYPMWQYTSKGKIDGINGNVDMNEAFLDFPSSISYLQMIVKLQTIKMKAGLEDLTLQYFNCYMWNEDLIKKIYNGLNKAKIKYKKEYEDCKWNIIQEYFELEDKTIQFMKYYLYANDLRDKLFASIVEA